ncbi:MULTISPECIES: helix-turn-helix domain-containing protein [Cupriavidus]|uniref:helix-turn-helix domain-containing protein n=1 Tax=Cupriavidus TaxID=106589 RepID=UPI0009EE02A4|nr:MULTISPECIES: helix-turn-helix transcriptional regulator [Cupriavidus]MCD9119736.1 helix-turn-helix domain-containing protein [Cupriavidus sp. UGS-1]
MHVPISDPEVLGQLVRAARLSQRLTRDEVARGTGLSPTFISNVEAGKSTAQLGKVLHLLRELGVLLSAEAFDVEPWMANPKTVTKRRVRK